MAGGSLLREGTAQVAALGVVGNVVSGTGIIEIVFTRIVGKPKSLTVALLRLILPALVLNVGISNTCVMSRPAESRR